MFRRVDAGEDIAQIAVSKIADVGGGESLALSEAAARVRIKNRPPSLDQRLSQTGPGECRMRVPGRPAVHDGHHRGLAAGVRRQQQPALHVECLAAPR